MDIAAPLDRQDEVLKNFEMFAEREGFNMRISPRYAGENINFHMRRSDMEIIGDNSANNGVFHTFFYKRKGGEPATDVEIEAAASALSRVAATGPQEAVG